MWCKLNVEQIIQLLNTQLNNHWGIAFDGIPEEAYPCIEKSLLKLERNFEKVRSGYFRREGQVAFKLEHSVQYSIFLYRLSHELYLDGFEETASYVYYLNKIMHNVDWFYAIELPDFFSAEHPLGTVLGRAKYSNYFFVYQGVTVGGNRRGDTIFYPQFGENVLLYANSTVLGDARIGRNVIISANTYIKDESVPDNCIVFGRSPNLIVKNKNENEIRTMTEHIWKFTE